MNPDFTLFIVQHCQSEHHVNDLTGGWTDTPLTELGQEQAARVAQSLRAKLNGTSPTLYSSDLLRASQTAEFIASDLGVAVQIDRDLREWNNGAAAGKTKAWVAENAAPLSLPGQGLDRRAFDGAETPREFFQRVTSCAERIVPASPSDQLVLVTHGGTVGALIAWWLGMTVEQYDLASFIAAAGSISTLGIDSWQRRTLVELNDTAHL